MATPRTACDCCKRPAPPCSEPWERSPEPPPDSHRKSAIHIRTLKSSPHQRKEKTPQPLGGEADAYQRQRCKSGPGGVRTHDQGIMSPLLSPLSYRPYCIEYQVFEYYLASFDLQFERSNELLEPPPDVSLMTTFPLTWFQPSPSGAIDMKALVTMRACPSDARRLDAACVPRRFRSPPPFRFTLLMSRVDFADGAG